MASALAWQHLKRTTYCFAYNCILKANSTHLYVHLYICVIMQSIYVQIEISVRLVHPITFFWIRNVILNFLRTFHVLRMFHIFMNWLLNYMLTTKTILNIKYYSSWWERLFVCCCLCFLEIQMRQFLLFTYQYRWQCISLITHDRFV